MKITFIGGSGFVGTRLIELLKEDSTNYSKIKNIDLLQSHFHPEVTEIGDVRDQACMDEKLQDTDCVILLAAQHRDDVHPTSLYYETNVGGMEKTLKAMEKNGVKRIVFYSSVAVYGLNKKNPNEEHPADPFNHYGKSKWQAEVVLQEWYKTHPDWNINIIRPTVIFGERNRGNVYNLLKQIASGKFLMVGNGNNKKSMAYVGNIVAFTKFLMENKTTGYNVYNYIDKPDFNMNELVGHVSKVLNKHIPTTHFPYWLGMLGGYGFDLLAKITGKKLTVSSVRVKKFCATTEFDATKVKETGFKAPYTLGEGLARTLEFEFIHDASNGITFKTE
ncbi:NAD-dependent epimerase/dehydratase family protein [Phocaeicola plebeius]|jgi:nucleoside-diphosphate-sugar epimerase|uniref:NAD-dependent epimerase/dehydratase family protein n=1 Tax=Phocaeicola plebeius TaxID=310297 RepID=UPI0026EE70F3|nr:NAD-dependent epimerase/dehydratase family protein [Phocaeicola plebeius]